MWFNVMVIAIGGVAVALQAHFMGMLDRGIGTIGSVFFTYAIGGLIISAVFLVQRKYGAGQLAAIPWYAYITGICGLVIVGSIGYTAPRIGLVPCLTIMTAAQFIISGFIDHFGLLGAVVRPIDMSKGLGMTAMLGGVYLMVR